MQKEGTNLKILLTTVGGTLEPVRTTWQHLRPDKTYFICSEDDPYSGKAGTYVEIGKGDDGKFAASLGLSADQFAVIRVPADRPDKAYRTITTLIDEIYRTIPDARIAADYTGGTKSMSASLFAAAIDYPEVEVFIVTGTRTNFVKVQDGTHQTYKVSTNSVHMEREFRLALKHWENYDYEATGRRLQQLIEGSDMSDIETNIYHAKQVSMAFGFWDRFQYEQAFEVLQTFSRVLDFLPSYVRQVSGILDKESAERRDYLRIWDLWFNALRRAKGGRYDDAVARLYRLLEASAQWRLQYTHQIYTGKVMTSQLPPDFRPDNGEESLKLGLFEAWRLLGQIDQGPLAKWIADEEHHLRYYLTIRNDSYLAHGHQPILEKQWREWQEWLEQSFLPAFQDQGRQENIKKLPKQLPDAWQKF